MGQEAHRSGPLKQQNKTHKTGQHRSKRNLELSAKGKVNAKKLTRKGSSHRQVQKQERIHKLNQLRKAKRDVIVAEKRKIGVEATAPILVLVYSYAGVPYDGLVQMIKSCNEELIVNEESNGRVHLIVPRFKLRYEFFTVDENNLYALMDGLKIADVLLLIHPLFVDEEDISDNIFINAMFSHFLPTTIHVATGLEDLPVKKRQESKKMLLKTVENRFPDSKVHFIDKPQDSLQLLNQIGNGKRKKLSYKKQRSQVLAEKMKFEAKTESGENGDLLVTGFVRNKPLNANNLIHIPGWGDYQIDMIEKTDDPYPMNVKGKNSRDTEVEMEEDASRVIQRSDPQVQESLEFENELDPMEGEQTFPTKDEIAEAQAKTEKEQRRVVKGTSEYQAAWIVDDKETDEGDVGSDDEDDFEDDDEDNDCDESGSDAEMIIKPTEEDVSEDGGDHRTVRFADDETNYETITVMGRDEDGTKYDETVNVDDEESALKKFREARENEMYPDEVDTPTDVAARVRFARYRGLKSFTYSPWDPKENLPSDYARIFQFENFNRTRRRVLKSNANDDIGAQAGAYVTIHVKNVPAALANFFLENPQHPLVLYGLLQHEQRMSVVNLVLKKQLQFEEPIKSKERLVYHVGCRRFYANAIFSAHTNGTKFKYERFLRPDEATIASVYAPITYAPAPVAVFKEYADGSQRLVASGSVLSVNPNRAVIKRIILSGHPFKIKNRTAVVRYMFFTREDIQWFKPIELRSKYGRRGHIREPLGTHGHMKCLFDRPLKSQDTVMMNLYKRIFPKWTYESKASHNPRVDISISANANSNVDQDMDE